MGKLPPSRKPGVKIIFLGNGNKSEYWMCDRCKQVHTYATITCGCENIQTKQEETNGNRS